VTRDGIRWGRGKGIRTCPVAPVGLVQAIVPRLRRLPRRGEVSPWPECGTADAVDSGSPGSIPVRLRILPRASAGQSRITDCRASRAPGVEPARRRRRSLLSDASALMSGEGVMPARASMPAASEVTMRLYSLATRRSEPFFGGSARQRGDSGHGAWSVRTSTTWPASTTTSVPALMARPRPGC
jgi:hypothetical protein